MKRCSGSRASFDGIRPRGGRGGAADDARGRVSGDPLELGNPGSQGTEASARAWLEVACVAYLFARLRVQPT